MCVSQVLFENNDDKDDFFKCCKEANATAKEAAVEKLFENNSEDRSGDTTCF